MGNLPGQQFDFKFVDIVPAKDFILPTLRLTFYRSSRPREHENPQDVMITNLNMQVLVKQNDYDTKVIGQAKSRGLQQTWKSNSESRPEFDLTLDHYTLYEIEKIRGNGDLNLLAKLTFQGYPVGQPSKMESYPIDPCDIPIAKSKWVEKILPDLNYKNVALVEMPRLEYPRLNKAIDMLNTAWRSYSIGDIDDVLVKTRGVLTELGNQVKGAGFENEEAWDKQGKQYMEKRPDWKRFLDSDSKGDIIKNITKKMFGFVSPGAHPGSILEMNHAYFALLQTFSLTHLVISRFKMLDEQQKSRKRRKTAR